MIKADIDSLKKEEREIFNFFKKQVSEFQEIKKICEKVEWDDELYNEFINSMNIIGKSLSQVIQTLTNNREVYLISEFIPYLNEYLEVAKKFPRV